MRTARAAISCPSSRYTTWRPSPGSIPTARYGVAGRAPNFRAWETARLPSPGPPIPAGDPREVSIRRPPPPLAPGGGALDDKRVEPLGGPVHGSGEPRRPGAHDEQVRLFPALELATDAERAQQVSARGVLQLATARKLDDGRLFATAGSLVVPRERQPVRPRDVDQAQRRLGGARADDLDADALHALQRLAAGDEGRKHQVAQRAVLEQEPAEDVTIDGDVPQRLRHDRGHEHGLPGKKVQLAEEARGAVMDDLV